MNDLMLDITGEAEVGWSDPAPAPTFSIIHQRKHKFVKREKRGCEECGKAKASLVHHGTPPSLNVHASRATHFVYQGQKASWEERLTELLQESGLPKDLPSIFVEGEVCFGDRIKRDQGNFRFLIEKALGDALVQGGWLEDDNWERYEFGRLRLAYEKGEAWTMLILTPGGE